MRALHIKFQSGTNYNFVAPTSIGQYQPPDMILNAIHRARFQR
jgi:hypothetical protein